jgi:micrococcal nuclease
MDGDRLILRKAGERDLVALQMIGIDAPQVSTRERAGQEPFGTMALQFLSVAITRKVVRVEQDVQRSSEGGDQMGYVWSGDKLMNEEMLRAGLAVVATVPPNVKYVERLMRAQADARTAKRGIWYPEAPLPQSPSEFRAAGREASEKQARAESAVELPGFQEGCAIGNRQTKKFHLPGGRYYEKAKTSKNAVFFSSGADAERAGYVQSAH